MNDAMKALVKELISLSPEYTGRRLLLDNISYNRLPAVEVISVIKDDDDETNTVVFKYKDKFYSFFSTYNSYNNESNYLVKSLKEVFPVEKVVVSYE